MKSVVYREFGGPIEILDVPDPSPPPDGVVLEVAATGVCRSDWHAWAGHDPSVSLPHTPGHEMSGRIVALGRSVEGFDTGDYVTVPFVLGCGSCRECVSGNPQICDNQYQPGFSGRGSFAQYVALPYAQQNLVALPRAIPPEHAALLGCRFSTAYRAIVDKGRLQAGESVAVWGCGGVGLSAVLVAASLGASVVAIDIDDDALDMARVAGATYVHRSTKDSDDASVVREILDGGADVSVDALGSRATAASSIECLMKRGKHVQVGLMIGDGSNPRIPMHVLHSDEIEMHGVHGMPSRQYPPMLDAISSGSMELERMPINLVDLSGGAEHLTRMDSFPGTGFTVIQEPGRPRHG